MSEPSPEPTVTVNGVTLTEGQVFALRVALDLLHSNLALGVQGSPVGEQTLATDTRTRVREILWMMGEDL